MDAYSSFASVYDQFMDNVPYEEWAEYLTGLLKEYQVNDGLVLDLGCGTGSLTEILAKKGYDMIGIDNSEDMLQMAMEKRADSGLDILYLLQDMREFELYGTVAAVVSICDSMNYLTDYEDLVETMRLVNNYDPETKINEYDLTLFIQEEEDLYRRFEETHYQKAYELEEVKQAIQEAGMEFVAVYDAFTHKEPDENSERVYFVAREQGKHW